MPLVEYIPDPSRYDDVFASQSGGSVMVRYRGSPYQNGSGFFSLLRNVFSKVGNFLRPVLAHAAPHAQAAINAAVPHLQEAATGAIKDVASKASDAIGRKLAPPQEGAGRKRKRVLKATRKPKRLNPFDIPDFI